MESELVQAINSITESINALAQPRFIDWLAVILSGLAIWFAVQVPKKVADRQDKIALFEKRYNFYIVLVNVLAFITELAILLKDGTELKKPVIWLTFSKAFLQEQEDDTISVKEIKNQMDFKYRYYISIISQVYFLFDLEKSDEDLINNLRKNVTSLLCFDNTYDEELKIIKQSLEYVAKINQDLLPKLKKDMTLYGKK